MGMWVLRIPAFRVFGIRFLRLWGVGPTDGGGGGWGGYQRVTRLSSITAEALREEIADSNLPLHATDKMVRKSKLEKILRRVFKDLPPEAFQEASRALNERIILKFGRGTHVDLAIVLALLTPLAGGQVAARKRTAFEALTWRRLGDGTLLSKGEVDAFVGMLKAVYLSGEPLPAMPVGQAGVVMKEEGFAETVDFVRAGVAGWLGGWGLGSALI